MVTLRSIFYALMYGVAIINVDKRVVDVQSNGVVEDVGERPNAKSVLPFEEGTTGGEHISFDSHPVVSSNSKDANMLLYPWI